MTWISRLLTATIWRGPDRLTNVRAPFPGWKEVERKRDFVVWRNLIGDVLSLSAVDDIGDLAEASDRDGVRNLARALAESSGAGLVEAEIVSPSNPRIVSLIYKKRVDTGFMFTGMLMVISEPFSWIWTVVDREKGMTGAREAAITSRMMKEGSLTPERYESEWAKDPYEPDYAGVDRENLRYLSDDPKYDEEFRTHPLAMIRRRFRDLKDIRVQAPSDSEEDLPDNR